MNGKAVLGALVGVMIAFMLLAPSTVSAWPENPGSGVIIETPILYRLSDVDVTVWDQYDPYYIEVTNDTLTLATVAGEFSMQFWATGEMNVNVTRFLPYTDQMFRAHITSAGEDMTLNFGGFAPGSVYLATTDSTSWSETANETGWLEITMSNVVDDHLSLTMQSSPPVFTTSPDIIAWALEWYSYDADVYPEDATITAITIPYWCWWDEHNWDLGGFPRDSGIFPVSLKASNSEGTVYQNFTITIYNQDIGFLSSPDLSVEKFDDYSYDVNYYPEDADLKCLVKPTWLHFNEHTDQLTGYANRAGSFDVVLRVTHGESVAYQNFTITVTDIIDPPDWNDTPSFMDINKALFYILIAAGVGFILLVFYMRRS